MGAVDQPARIVFGVSGASGLPLAETVLQSFASLPDLEIHLVISNSAFMAGREEGADPAGFGQYAAAVYRQEDIGAPFASGSWLHDGMVICPCSMSSLAAIATGAGTNLLHRAADVALKERRPLVLAARESPYSLLHIRNMLAVTEAGGVVMPFAPAFYTGDNSMHAAMRQFAGRILDILRIPHNLCMRWKETGGKSEG